MSQPLYTRHWWEKGSSSFTAVRHLKSFGEDYPEEDVVWGAWEEILPRYFPKDDLTDDGVHYEIKREPYRGPKGQVWEHRPDQVVVKVSEPVMCPDGVERDARRDVLWVECKAPVHDQPNEWKKFMEQVVGRLSSAHPDRNVWVILATGLKWMPFYWNPTKSNPQPLTILDGIGKEVWGIDKRMHIAPISGQSHYKNNSCIITKQANTLDFWTKSRRSDEPEHLETSMLFLEKVMDKVQKDVYKAELNPAHFS